MKALVVYYSLFGNTKFVAEKLAGELGAEIHKTSDLGVDLSQYDLVAVGTPIWAGKARWPVNNFLKRNDFTGKKLALFCTRSGSGENAFPAMEEIASTKAASTKDFITPKKDEEKTISEIRAWAKTLK